MPSNFADVGISAVSIRPMQNSDFQSVLHINAESVPHVTGLNPRELRHILDIGALAWVALSAETPTAYLLAVPYSAPYWGEEFRFFKHRLANFLYIDQVAVAQEHRRQRFATALYETATQWARRRRISTLCCEVNVRPPNGTSLRFHRQLGFTGTDQLQTSDGRHVVL